MSETERHFLIDDDGEGVAMELRPEDLRLIAASWVAGRADGYKIAAQRAHELGFNKLAADLEQAAEDEMEGVG